MKKARFMLNSHVATLCLLALALVLGGCIYLCCVSESIRTSYEFYLAMGIPIVILLGCLTLDYETLGWVTITRESIILHAPLRRALTLRYEDVTCVGIGSSYGETRDRRNDKFIYTPSHDFWLYLSMDPVPLAQLNDMRKFKLTRRGVRIAYSKKVYSALMDALPPHLRKELQRHQTTLRAHGFSK